MNRREADELVERMDSRSRPKLCTDCKHYSPGVYSLKAGGMIQGPQCNSPKNASLVDGQPRLDPEQARYSFASGTCQETGYWWEPK